MDQASPPAARPPVPQCPVCDVPKSLSPQDRLLSTLAFGVAYGYLGTLQAVCPACKKRLLEFLLASMGPFVEQAKRSSLIQVVGP